MIFLDKNQDNNLLVNWSFLSKDLFEEAHFQNEVFLSENLLSNDLSKTIFEEINKESLEVLNTRVSSNENKSHTKHFGPLTGQLISVFNSNQFIRFVEKTFRLKKNSLKSDSYFSGGGIHFSKKNQFLKMHQDFNYHPITYMKRVINLIIYLNDDWIQEYGGILSLTRKKRGINEIVKVIPKQRQIMFRTDTNIWHGVDEILADKNRVSIALYYYQKLSFFSILMSLFTGRMTRFHSHKGIKNLIPYFQHKLMILKNIFFRNK